jgi:amino acid transporter
MLFRDTVLKADGAGDPLRQSVHRGLGPMAGRMVPLCFVLVVVVGLPSNAVAGAHLLTAVVPLPMPHSAVAAGILGIGVATNLIGARTNARAQAWAAGTLVVVLLVAATVTLGHPEQEPALVPEISGLGAVPAGMLLAFWAFVGFENLTFVARDLRHPRRDFGVVAVAALGLLVGLALLLTLVIAVRLVDVDPLTGVINAVRVGAQGPMIAAVVAGVGAGGVLLNVLAWVRGCALVLEDASREGIVLPGLLVSPGEAPRRAIGVLTGGFAVTLTVLTIWPGLVVDLLAAASAVFVMIYVLCIVAYLRSRPAPGWAVANVLVLGVMVVMLVGSGWRAAYGLVVFAVAALVAGPVHRRWNVRPSRSDEDECEVSTSHRPHLRRRAKSGVNVSEWHEG